MTEHDEQAALFQMRQPWVWYEPVSKTYRVMRREDEMMEVVR